MYKELGGKTMDIKIRPIKIEDAEGINALRIMDGVRENILGITSERIDRSKNFISNLKLFYYQ